MIGLKKQIRYEFYYNKQYPLMDIKYKNGLNQKTWVKESN